MDRTMFINELEKLIGWEVDKIDWIYGASRDNIGGDAEDLFTCDLALVVSLCDERGESYYVEFTADSYCSDPMDILNSLESHFEESGLYYNDLPLNVDVDKLASILRDYFYSYDQELDKDKPFLDLIDYELY